MGDAINTLLAAAAYNLRHWMNKLPHTSFVSCLLTLVRQLENLLEFVQTLPDKLVRAGVLPQDYDFEAHEELIPMQAGDSPTTFADATALERDFGSTPKITLRDGLPKFAE